MIFERNGRKKYALLDATQERVDVRVTFREREGIGCKKWCPNW